MRRFNRAALLNFAERQQDLRRGQNADMNFTDIWEHILLKA